MPLHVMQKLIRL